jgi:hypothetical protein
LPATYFGLGSALHETIERTITVNLDLDQALADVEKRIGKWLEEADLTRVIESSVRTIDSMYGDARRMMHNWFNFAHPWSPKRHPVYEEYQWPPATELPFKSHAGTWGSVDTLYYPKKDTTPRLIVDWKSGARPPKSDFQLNFYRRGLSEEEARAGYHMLDRVRVKSVFLEAAPFTNALPIIANIGRAKTEKERMLAGKMPEFFPGWQCDYCTVRHHCPEKGETPRKNKKALKKHLKLLTPMDDIALFEVPDDV